MINLAALFIQWVYCAEAQDLIQDNGKHSKEWCREKRRYLIGKVKDKEILHILKLMEKDDNEGQIT